MYIIPKKAHIFAYKEKIYHSPFFRYDLKKENIHKIKLHTELKKNTCTLKELKNKIIDHYFTQAYSNEIFWRPTLNYNKILATQHIINLLDLFGCYNYDARCTNNKININVDFMKHLFKNGKLYYCNSSHNIKFDAWPYIKKLIFNYRTHHDYTKLLMQIPKNNQIIKIKKLYICHSYIFECINFYILNNLEVFCIILSYDLPKNFKAHITNKLNKIKSQGYLPKLNKICISYLFEGRAIASQKFFISDSSVSFNLT